MIGIRPSWQPFGRWKKVQKERRRVEKNKTKHPLPFTSELTGANTQQEFLLKENVLFTHHVSSLPEVTADLWERLVAEGCIGVLLT